MEPFLLLELAAGASHGYELVRAVASLGFRRAAVDPSVVYKVLRNLEQWGLVQSEWAVGDDAPPRRMYRLTTEGTAHLHARRQDLERQAERIRQFFVRYQKLFPDATASQEEDSA